MENYRKMNQSEKLCLWPADGNSPRRAVRCGGGASPDRRTWTLRTITPVAAHAARGPAAARRRGSVVWPEQSPRRPPVSRPGRATGLTSVRRETITFDICIVDATRWHVASSRVRARTCAARVGRGRPALRDGQGACTLLPALNTVRAGLAAVGSATRAKKEGSVPRYSPL